ncbi:hypothetical protein TNCV_1709041 [Trichonephila clavipes]|nr:hypothetical protein TNCV_1709041 [Trichonephila clavipes]
MASDDQVILALGFAAICDIEMRKAKKKKKHLAEKVAAMENTIRMLREFNEGISSRTARGLLTTDHVILNHGQVTWMTPELAPFSPNYHTTPTGKSFNSQQI